ncbi:hypothetical protein [Thermococcus sp. ES12]|uniref:hypothetical protein n=1 Tax=Thermococcus sp. ES12 TaxID=1638246 RepID=UPI00142F9D60|nr:hypothetical protein [Thermococcus sp. ES12]
MGRGIITLLVVLLMITAGCIAPNGETPPTETTTSLLSVNVYPYEVNGTPFVNFTFFF